MKTQCMKMKVLIEEILEKRNMTDKFNTGSFHLKIINKPFMPLAIERHGRFVSITHYYEQNGDLVPDPDFEMYIGYDGNWYPVSLQHAFGRAYFARCWEDGKEFVDKRQAHEQIDFSEMWASNIRQQGFIRAGI